MAGRRRDKRSVYPIWQATFDSLAYIADDIGAPYPQRPFAGLDERQLMTARTWAQTLITAIEAEQAERQKEVPT